MDITIESVKKEEKEILKNLLEKYEYEFSQYNNLDVNELGVTDMIIWIVIGMIKTGTHFL